ncbi:MAG: hypothetical protein KC502_08735, partial [Myxococcales bacterium]|nr:hypothetical protein [Myxococcales bacterium]
PTAPTPAIEEPSPARGRDWSTGMFRINEESALPEEDDEINVADVPATKRRSGLFTIPEARGGAERQRPTTEPTLARDDRQAGWRNTPAGTPRANDGQRRAAEFTGARRPSGQFAAMRRSAGQYDIPSRRVPADFNAPPVAPPSEPVDRVRQRTTGGYAARSESAPSDQPPTRRPITRPQGSLAKSETREDAPWAPSQPTEHPPGVHVDPPLLETGPHNEPRLSEEFRRAQAAQLPNGDADW